jgi:hypothetical protein
MTKDDVREIAELGASTLFSGLFGSSLNLRCND